MNYRVSFRCMLTLLMSAFIMLSCKEKKQEATQAAPKREIQKKEPTGKAPEVLPVSHASAVLNWGGTTVYIDPVGSAETYNNYPPADLILITDIHGDHFSLETLQGLQTENAKIVVPQAVADKMPDSFAAQIDVLHNGDQKERHGILVTAIPMYNLREEATAFHEKGRGNGYVMEKEGRRVYFSGDTEDIPEMRALQDIDMAFICMNLPYTMTVERAADAVLEFTPAAVYPYHYRGRPDVSDVGEFARIVAEGNPDIEVVQLDWYPMDPY
jgi:L-ascorbate metabolism protein UlaG (beta-lactamase superfamily)